MYRYDMLKKVQKINEVGVSRIKRIVAEHHPRGLKNFDRNISLIRDYALYGSEHCMQKYNVCKTASTQMLKIFYQYALDAEKEDADVREQ